MEHGWNTERGKAEEDRPAKPGNFFCILHSSFFIASVRAWERRAGRPAQRPRRSRSPGPKGASGQDFPAPARGDYEVARQIIERLDRAGRVERARGAQGQRQTPEMI